MRVVLEFQDGKLHATELDWLSPTVTVPVPPPIPSAAPTDGPVNLRWRSRELRLSSKIFRCTMHIAALGLEPGDYHVYTEPGPEPRPTLASVYAKFMVEAS